MDCHCPKCGKEMLSVTIHSQIKYDKNYEYFCCMSCMVLAKKSKDTDGLPMPYSEVSPITKEALDTIEPTPLPPNMFSMPIDDDLDIEHYQAALEEARHYESANTLGYFFDSDFDGTIQEYYDNTVPHA